MSRSTTPARHAGESGYTTQIGSDRFTVFRTGPSKSRQAFLSRLCGGTALYVINAAALEYMRDRQLPQAVIDKFADHKERIFSSPEDWERHLQALGITDLNVAPDPVLIASEGALWGAIRHQGLLEDTVIVSDDAGQFRVGVHALCWVQYLESDLILSAGTEGLTWRGNHPEMTQDKNRRSKRPQERQEISLGFPWLGQIRLDADMLPEGLKDVALHPQVSRQVTAGRRQARVTKIVANCRQVGS